MLLRLVAVVFSMRFCLCVDCTIGQFQCNSGQCATVLSRCQGKHYCADFSDQANCSTKCCVKVIIDLSFLFARFKLFYDLTKIVRSHVCFRCRKCRLSFARGRRRSKFDFTSWVIVKSRAHMTLRTKVAQPSPSHFGEDQLIADLQQ